MNIWSEINFPLLSNHGKLISDRKEVANIFNNYFIEVSSNKAIVKEQILPVHLTSTAVCS